MQVDSALRFYGCVAAGCLLLVVLGGSGCANSSRLAKTIQSPPVVTNWLIEDWRSRILVELVDSLQSTFIPDRRHLVVNTFVGPSLLNPSSNTLEPLNLHLDEECGTLPDAGLETDTGLFLFFASYKTDAAGTAQPYSCRVCRCTFDGEQQGCIRLPLDSIYSVAAAAAPERLLVFDRTGALYSFDYSFKEQWHYGKTRAFDCCTEDEFDFESGRHASGGRDGRAYFVDSQSVVICLSARGEELWRFSTGKALGVNCAVDNAGTCYCVSSKDATAGTGSLIALDTAGKKRWEVAVLPSKLNTSQSCPMISALGLVLLLEQERRICGFDRDGNECFRRSFDGKVRSWCVLDDGQIVVCVDDQGIFCLSADGSRLWHTSAPAHVDSFQQVDGNLLYAFDACDCPPNSWCPYTGDIWSIALDQ